MNQWRNTSKVIEWFKAIGNKQNHRFVQFDIVEFYPSISKELLNKALEFASSYTEITQQVTDIIHHSRASVLFTKKDVWIKKDGDLFDVTMGSFDGAEVCEVTGLYLFHQLKSKFPGIDMGLYRDDGLGRYENLPGPASDKIRKEITKLFKDNGLQITINMNLNTVDFLDCTFDLGKDLYYPYRKENSSLLYINRDSSHPPNIKKQLPAMIEKRLSDLSSNQAVFERARPEYEKALQESGFRKELRYSTTPPPRRTRSRAIIWFNPP